MAIKRIHINESQLNEMFDSYNRAGTDNPYYKNEETNEEYEGNWYSDYAFPFGYWPTTYGSTDVEFALGEPWTTHVNPCGKCAQEYYNDGIQEMVGDAANFIEDALSDVYSYIKDGDFQFSESEWAYVSSDGSDIKTIDDFVDEIKGNLYDNAYCMCGYLDLNKIVEKMLNGGIYPSYQEIESELYESLNNYDFSNKDGINYALETFGMNFNDFFELGKYEGRIFVNDEIISFYPSEQPEPYILKEILEDLSNCENLELSVEDMLRFHIIFEDWKNDGEVTACTVSDYINGNYGKYKDSDDDEEVERQYSNGEKTVFVPHLANQDQKREYYKDFRDTKARSIYVPREKGGNGTLAQYHAMRYPYGENKERKNTI